MAMENHYFLIADTSSNGCFSIVVLVSGGVTVTSRFVPFFFGQRGDWALESHHRQTLV